MHMSLIDFTIYLTFVVVSYTINRIECMSAPIKIGSWLGNITRRVIWFGRCKKTMHQVPLTQLILLHLQLPLLSTPLAPFPLHPCCPLRNNGLR